MSDGGLIASEGPLEVQIKTNRRISPRERRHRRCIKRGEAIAVRKAIMAARTQCVPGGGEVRSACQNDRLFNDHLSSNRRLTDRRSSDFAGARSSLYVEARVEHHPRDQDKQQSRACAAYSQPWLDPVHFHDQFFLLFGHVGLSAVQEELVVFMHGKGAAVNEEND